MAGILYSPNTTEMQQLMTVFAKQAACPTDPKKTTIASSFYQYFKSSNRSSECQPASQCFASAQCYQHVAVNNLKGFASEADAVDYASRHPHAVDAALIFDDTDFSSASATHDYAYTIRMNHTHMPSSRQLLNVFDILPDPQYRRYWFFSNLQQLTDQAILAVATAQSDSLSPVSVSFEPFPWPAVTVDIGAAASSIAFNLLLVYSFLAPTRSTVASIVREKELRLREGMRILGLQVSHSPQCNKFLAVCGLGIIIHSMLECCCAPIQQPCQCVNPVLSIVYTRAGILSYQHCAARVERRLPDCALCCHHDQFPFVNMRSPWQLAPQSFARTFVFLHSLYPFTSDGVK